MRDTTASVSKPFSYESGGYAYGSASYPPNYRLEDRRVSDGSVVAATEQGYDGPLVERGEALARFDREVREHARRYGPHDGHRLVVLGPDRTVLPQSIETVGGL